MTIGRKRLYFVILLIAINLLAHFLPLERASLAPDDYVFLTRSKNIEISRLPYQMLRVAFRPLNHAACMLQAKLVGDNPKLTFILLVLSSTLVLLSVFCLLSQLSKSIFMAFLGSVIFCLLPNKLEIYHNSVFFNLNIAVTISILCLVFYLHFIKTQSKQYLVAAISAYCVATFWYPVGFFIPIIMAVYAWLYARKYLKYILYFAPITVFYIVYRLTNIFGLAESVFEAYKVEVSLMPTIHLLDLFHHYFGRYMARNIIYGFYKFFTIEQPWLIVLLLLNLALLFIVAGLARKKELPKTDNRLLFFGAVLFVVFLLPFFLNKQAGIASRYLTLPSIGVAIFAIWLLQKMKRLWRPILLIFIGITLIVCQGNAWTQVVACRINAAIHQTIEEQREELSLADNIIIDARSLANNIPFTLIQRDFNVLDTYYGAQVIHDAGLNSMVKLALDNSKQRQVYIALESPKAAKDQLWELSIAGQFGYRSIVRKVISLPRQGTAIIDFQAVYENGFDHGLRGK